MISVELLVENGFKKYYDSVKRTSYSPSYVESYQLKVTDDIGIKYFVNIDVWDHRELLPQIKELGYAAHSQFNGHGEKNNTFNVELFIDEDTTLEYILNFFENIFKNMNCDYYDAD